MASPALTVLNLTLADGRNLEYIVTGATDGVPLVYLHGTPEGYTPPCGLDVACANAGLKLISYSRSGYGESTRRRGRSVADEVNDVAALLKHVGVDRCLVAGWSGGGPHALACAARLPGAVAVLVVAGVAPFDVEGLDWFDGQGEDNVREYKAAAAGEELLTRFITGARQAMLAADAESLVDALGSLLSAADKRVMSEHPELGRNFVDFLQVGLKHSGDGWIDDDLAFVRPWGFELGETRAPVVWYHGTEDLMCPVGHGRWMVEHMPRDKIRPLILEGEGHISIFWNRIEEGLAELLKIWRAQA